MELISIIIFIIGVLLVLLLIGLLIYAIYLFIAGGVYTTYHSISNLPEQLRPLNQKYKIHLENHFRYYKNLSHLDKRKFEKRVKEFILSKNFIGRGKIKKVDDGLKALIAATAVQLTFGLQDIRFVHFDKILVYPDSYFSTIRKQYHNGEVHVNGIIVFSAKTFLKGILNENDGRNLGLHEMAHALLIENRINNSEYGFFQSHEIIRFKTLAKKEIEKVKNKESKFFRSYSATNLMEFFSVTVELFFEKPNELYEHNSELYKHISDMLWQDPLNKNYKSL